MDETLKFNYGEDVAKVYEQISLDLAKVDEKHTELKDYNGNPKRANQFYRYTLQPVSLFCDSDIPIELKNDIITVFDKYLKRSDI